MDVSLPEGCKREEGGGCLQPVAIGTRTTRGLAQHLNMQQQQQQQQQPDGGGGGAIGFQEKEATVHVFGGRQMRLQPISHDDGKRRRRRTTPTTRSSRTITLPDHSLRNSLLFLFAALLVAPRVNTSEETSARWRQFVGGRTTVDGSGVRGRQAAGPVVTLGMGVLGAPCVVDAGGAAQQVEVTEGSSVESLLSLFDCEDGEFNVSWSGVVTVPGTIRIGQGTTVRIVGDIDSVTNDTTVIASSGSDVNNTDQEWVEALSNALPPLPSGLPSAAVGSASSTQESGATTATGPLFLVEGGQLFLKNLAVRGGVSSNSTSAVTDSSNGTVATVVINGGGIHAVDATVTVTGCEFEDNFAELWGGAIFANGSTLVVRRSVFRRCEAGVVPEAGDENVDGAGGAIGVEYTDVLIDGCLFEQCFASMKGGAMHQGVGQISVLNSLFYNNTAGSDNIESEEAIGEGAAISFTSCNASFDGLSVCGANDTVFYNNHVGRKGGAVAIGSGSSRSHIELHRCTVSNTTTGKAMEDDPQGEGGAFAVAWGVTLVLADSLFSNNYCGKKGGVVTMSSGDSFPEDPEDEPGPVVFLRNSTFTSNTAELENAGVVNLGEYGTLTVEGDGNVFAQNESGGDGGVFGATSDTVIFIEGGSFVGNVAMGGGGVLWTKGNTSILAGNFSGNAVSDGGGVILASEESTTYISGGLFEKNEATDGGVVIVQTGAAVVVEGGVFVGNIAGNGGGVFSAEEDGHIDITGGNFTGNEADFGGMLLKEGAGNASCTDASVDAHIGVDGGAIYAVEGATLDWGCDLNQNSALVGPAIYARDGANVILRGVRLFDNFVARGSVVFVASSNLSTLQVEFIDPIGYVDLSAVQTDGASTYKAEGTSFVGFAGEAVVFSEGTLVLDECDFSGSSASVLVSSGDNSATVIRNAVLGDKNYENVTKAASAAQAIPTASSLINVDVTCDGEMPYSSAPPCSEGSTCMDGHLGVYCQCYIRESTLEEICVSGDPELLSLQVATTPEAAFFPSMLEGDLLLTLEDGEATIGTASTKTTSSGVSWSVVTGGTDGGVVWNVSTLPLTSTSGGDDSMEWTVFPSTGLLLPGRSISLRVVTLPGEGFNGDATVSFQADGMSPPPAPFTADGNDDGGTAARAMSQQDYAAIQATSLSEGNQGGNNGGVDDDDGNALVQTTSSSDEVVAAGGADATVVSFNVSFYHCASGTFWVDDCDAEDGSDSCCELCTDVEGDEDGVDCELPGATTGTLPIVSGYWRASLDSVFIRKCFNEDACSGGSIVADAQEYCNAGYEGPQCGVCASGYAAGVADACHLCSASFIGGMYFVLTVVVLMTFVVVALLAVYLVGGRGAVSTTMSQTRQSVRMLHRRSSGLLWSETTRGRLDFGSIGRASGGRNIKKGSGRVDGDRVDGRSVGWGRLVDLGGRRKRSSVGGDATPGLAFSASSKPGDFGAGSMRGESRDEPDSAAATFSPALAPLAHGSSPAAAAAAPPAAAAEEGKSTSGLALSEPSDDDAPTDKDGRIGGQRASRITVGRSSSGRGLCPPGAQAAGSPGLVGAGGGRDGRESRESDSAKEKSAAARIGEALSRLPLSKVKIVIVVWQISSAFADITKVQFPPAYDKFLSIIGIFSFDLGWMISAACLTQGIHFYDKLLIVTIGPAGLLLLLCVTFYLGARPVIKGWITNDASARNSSSTASQSTLSATSRNSASGTAATSTRRAGSKRFRAAGGPGVGDAIDSSLPAVAGGRGPRSSSRSVWRNGPGDGSEPEQSHLWQLFARHTTMTLIILYLVYTQVSTVVFQMFACEDFPEIDKSFLRADFRIECYTPTYYKYRIYAGVMVCIYPLGIPAAFCYFLMRQRSRINPPSDKTLKALRGSRHVVNEKMNQRKTDQAIAPTSFLWNAYYPNRYYFEVCECMRRLLLTGLLVFLVPDTAGQVAFGCVFAFLSLLLFELLRPHVDYLDRQLYRTGSLVIFFTNFLALMIKADVASESSRGSAAYSVVLIIVNIMFFLSIFCNVWAVGKASVRRSHVQAMVLGVDILDRDQLNKVLGKKKKTSKRTKQQKLDEALGPDDGTGIENALREGKIEDLEAPPAWEVDPNDPPDSPVDISSRVFKQGLSGHSVSSTVGIPSTSWSAPSRGTTLSDGGNLRFSGRQQSGDSAAASWAGGSYRAGWGGPATDRASTLSPGMRIPRNGVGMAAASPSSAAGAGAGRQKGRNED